MIVETDIALPPMETFDHAIITAPLTKTMIARLKTNSNPFKRNDDHTMNDAYIKWYKDDIAKGL